MTYQFARGGWIACLGAGPVFIATLLSSIVLENPAQPIVVEVSWGQIIGAGLAMVFPVMLVGGLLALFPVWLGTKLLAWAGARNIGLRHPAFWGIAGGAMPALLLPFMDLGSGRQFGTTLIATGAICALIARYGTRWDDDSA